MSMSDKNKKKTRKVKGNRKGRQYEDPAGTHSSSDDRDASSESSNGNEKKSTDTNGEWLDLHRRPFRNEFEAFAQYYEKIKDDNSVLDLVQGADILGLSSYCDLYEGLEITDKMRNCNIEHRPLKKCNDRILYASPLVQLKETPEKGRHLVAHCQIDRNEIIINEKATILQVNPLCSCVGDEDKLLRCHDCAKVCTLFYTCNNCNVVVFCSLDCLRRAYKCYHKFECEGLQRHYWSLKETDYSYLAMRMVLYGAMNKFDTTLENEKCYGSLKSNYPFIYRLKSNFYKMPQQKIQQILQISTRTLVYLIFRTNFFKQFNLEDDQMCSEMYLYVGGLLVKHYCQAQMNNVLLKFPNVTRGFGFNVASGRGKAICPTIALLNHSCAPNAVIIPYNNYMVVKSIKGIRPDEEITVCYGEISAFLPIMDRHTITEELFYFTCTCSFCEYEKKWEEEPYKCTLCVNGTAKKVVVNGGKEMGRCSMCGKCFDINQKAEKLASVCLRLYKINFEIDHVLRIAECYAALYPRNSWLLLDVYKLLYDKYAVWGEKPIETIKYGLLTFNILEHYLSRLYMPLLEAKLTFYTNVTTNDKFLGLQEVTDFENDTLKIFNAEITKTKRDLLFFVPIQFADFYIVGIMAKLEQVQSNLVVTPSKLEHLQKNLCI